MNACRGHFADRLVRGGIDDVDIIAGLRFHELAINEETVNVLVARDSHKYAYSLSTIVAMP